MYQAIVKELNRHADPARAKNSLWFFKTGKGEYGEGDKFIGVGGTIQRQIAKKFKDADLSVVQKLLNGKIHEYRQTAVLILVYKYPKADVGLKKRIYELYLKNTKNINNWDIVDISTPHVVGAYLWETNCHSECKRRIPSRVLYRLAKSKNLWERRISVLATFMFIKHGDYADSLRIAQILINDKHDLIHKAVGWMLREVGNRDRGVEEKFLKEYHKKMPRTMLRYAIEKFPEPLRKKYLAGKVS